MKRLTLPQPPDPANGQYTNQLAYNRAVHDWCARVKGLVEDGWRINSAPCGQQMLATSFTTGTVVTGTTTGTDLANVVASLIQALTDKGILSPTASRSATE